MRFYLWYKKDGTVGSAATVTGGFAPSCDLSDSNTSDPTALAIRRGPLKDPEFSGWIAVDCPCPPSKGNCDHPAEHTKLSYVEDGILRSKPEINAVVDGVAINDSSIKNPIDRPPGTTLMLYLQGNVVDGHQVLLRSSKHIQVLEQDVVLIFTGGKTQTVNLKAPAQGMVGWACGNSKYVSHFAIYVRGWV